MEKSKVRTVPEGYYTVTPFVLVRGAAKFTDFLKDAFGAEELFPPVKSEDGSIGHAEVRIGDSVVMYFDSKPYWPATPSFLRLYVGDCETTYQQALKAGATSMTRPTIVPWGDQIARVSDPFGNLWWIMSRIDEVDEAEMARRAGQQQYIDAVEYVQNAQFFPPPEDEAKS